MLRCDRCGHQNSADALLCLKCGDMLSRPTSPLPAELLRTIARQPSFGSSMLDPDLKLLLHIGESSILLPFPHHAELILGRAVHTTTDTIMEPVPLVPMTGNTPVILDETPDVLNLETYQGTNSGVSRKHARITHEGYVLTLQDLGSTNGTCLNGDRLRAGEKRILRDNDAILLGMLNIKLRFH